MSGSSTFLSATVKQSQHTSCFLLNAQHIVSLSLIEPQLLSKERKQWAATMPFDAPMDDANFPIV